MPKLPGTPRAHLQLVLWLVAAHSVAVGLGLLWQRPALLLRLGFAPISEPFFPAQGGVMHLILATGYALAARDPAGRGILVVFAVFVKTAATVFLILWWLFAARQWGVLASGVSDGLMALLIAGAYVRWRRSAPSGRC